MNVNEREHVYECVPPVLGNEKLPEEEQCIIGLMAVYQPENDKDSSEQLKATREFTPDKASELIDKVTINRMRAKLVFIKNLTYGKEKRPITEFDDFYENAPAELVRWVGKAINSTWMLSGAEIKN